MPATPAETDPSVCYRHPDRTSWTLCTRCGRTICPECQILTPAGVRCPDCVREEGGSVRWEPAAGPRPATKAKAQKARMQRSRTADPGERPAWLSGAVGRFLLPAGGGVPIVSLIVLGLLIVLYILEYVLNNLPIFLLTVTVSTPWQLWGYVTSAVVYPATGSIQSIFSFLLQVVFWVIAAPRIELGFGRRRFLGIFLVSNAVGSAVMVISGAGAFGLGAGMWGLFGAYLVTIWEYRQARTQYMIILGILLLLNIIQRDFQLPGVIAGGLAGVGTVLALTRFADRPGTRPRTPMLVIGGVVLVLIVGATLRALADLPT